MAQQRTSTPRRSLNAATRPNYNTIAWLPIAIAGADATFQLSQDSASLVRSGVPRIFAASLAQLPLSVAWSGATMILTYSAPLAAIESFSCPLLSPEVRNQSGGYLAANTVTFGNPTPAPAGTIFAPYCSGWDLRGAIADGFGGTTDQLVTAESVFCGFPLANIPLAWNATWLPTPTDLFITLPNVAPSLVVNNIASIINLTTGQPPISFTNGSTIITATFALPGTPGDIISFTGTAADIANDYGQTLWSSNVVSQ